MDLIDYLDPVELDRPEGVYQSDERLGLSISIHTPNTELPDLSNYNLAIIGVPEDRNSNNKGSSLAPNLIRSSLYQLIGSFQNTKLIDLGNIKQGNTFTDTYFALKDVVYQLLCRNIVVIILGGTQDLTTAIYNAYELFKTTINLITVDNTIDFKRSAVEATSESYLSDILLKKSKLFKYANLGHQTYLTERNTLGLITKLYHEAVRLGSVRQNIAKVEPLLRDSDIISFDIGSIKNSDAPGRKYSSPNGFYSDEACLIARYSGLSDHLGVFGIFETNPKYDLNNQTSTLAAQIVWHFIDGFDNKLIEHPSSEESDFKTFIVNHSDLDHDMVFYKSLATERWWIEVPHLNDNKKTLISCSYEDYIIASKHEVPDIWWKNFQKLN